jgi:hypothetical protein
VKFLSIGKDGGPKSTVTGYWLAEVKRLFSVVLLRFDDGSRDEYHNHAFDSVNWVLKGKVLEQHLDGRIVDHGPSLSPVVTRRDTFHRVVSKGTTWVFSLRGPWKRIWTEWDPKRRKYTDLTHGRVKVGEIDGRYPLAKASRPEGKDEHLEEGLSHGDPWRGRGGRRGRSHPEHP